MTLKKNAFAVFGLAAWLGHFNSRGDLRHQQTESQSHRKIVWAIVGLSIVCASQQARALCTYNGVDNAKTTIAQEFADSEWVVRAKVLDAKDHFSDEDDSWTLYRIEVIHTYKGHPSKQLRFFTFRDSGGFYMDRPWVQLPAGHDIGGEYLLFLNPVPRSAGLPGAADGSVFVNYSCGVSGSWTKVPDGSRGELNELERQSRKPTN